MCKDEVFNDIYLTMRGARLRWRVLSGSDGFLLYSLGANGEDDGGSDSQGEFVDGESAPIDWLNERPKPDGPDDLVVGLPIPVLEMPRFE